MAVCEIQGHLEEMYGSEASPSLFSSLNNAVAGEVKAWLNRPEAPSIYSKDLIGQIFKQPYCKIHFWSAPAWASARLASSTCWS